MEPLVRLCETPLEYVPLMEAVLSSVRPEAPDVAARLDLDFDREDVLRRVSWENLDDICIVDRNRWLADATCYDLPGVSPNMVHYQVFVDRVQADGLKRGMTMFARGSSWYPPGSHGGWHTNSPVPGLRRYYIYNSEAGSLFKAQDPRTGERLEIEEPAGWHVKEFPATYYPSCWHAIWAKGVRLSLGFMPFPLDPHGEFDIAAASDQRRASALRAVPVEQIVLRSRDPIDFSYPGIELIPPTVVKQDDGWLLIDDYVPYRELITKGGKMRVFDVTESCSPFLVQS